jgi:methyl-accepting chemotaxis protein
MGVSDLITKGLIPLGGLAIMTTNLIIVAHGIARPIQRAVKGITEGADEVADASDQIASASNTLSSGATDQAASIEETSASLEEMSAMTRQNSEHAGQADQLMKETNNAVMEAQSAMAALNTSMGEISAASEETQKIIKTIDEIAFQTNLLALNAAVEAARAGEAGAGFAVVADEVRNLALRAAEASRSTADLIEETVRKVEDGAKTVGEASEVFVRVVSNSGKAGELVNGIASASSEQAQGIAQINTAVAEMDKVVQQNAATAEEAAAATESICGQADRMRERISELSAMVFDARREGGRMTETHVVSQHKGLQQT